MPIYSTITRTFRFIGLLALLILPRMHAWADETPFPRTRDFVNDYAHVLSDSDVRSLTTICRDLQTGQGYQLLIVTLPTLNGEDINHAAVRYGNEQQAGRKGADTGIVMMLAMAERQSYIATGSGTESVITDAKAARVCRNVMRPLLREGRTGDALQAGAQSIATIIQSGGSAEPMPLDGGNPSGGSVPSFFVGSVFFLAIGVAVLAGRAALKCPRCGQMMSVSNHIVEPATLFANGCGIRTRTCPACGFSDTNSYTIFARRGTGYWGGGSSGGFLGGGGGFSGGGGSFGGGGGGSSW